MSEPLFGYVGMHDDAAPVMLPGLGERAGLLGALLLARRAAR